MRILHVIPGFTLERGGPATAVQAFARHQARAGHMVSVLTTDQGARRGERPVPLEEGIFCYRVSVHGPDRLAFAPRFCGVCRDLLRAADVVHVHSIFTYPVHVALREALVLGVPVVLKPCGQLHHFSLRLSRWKKAAYLRLWGGMVRRACSLWHYTSSQEEAGSWLGDAVPHVVLPNGIEPLEFAVDRKAARREVERTWPQLAGSPYVVFLGRLHPKKRLDLLLEAFLCGAPSAWKLVVAGPDEARLWEGLASRFLNNSTAVSRVLRIPLVGGRAKVDLLAGASLFALPSEHENFGTAALEALAAGTPVLLSPHVNLGEDAATAGWAETVALDPSAWRARFASLTADAPPRSHDPADVRAWAAKHYAWDGLTRTLEMHYHRLRGVVYEAPAPHPASKVR